MTNKPIIAALTGAYASGKSLTAEYFRELGADIIDADVLAREVVQIGKPAYFEIIKEFSDDILLPDKTLNRKKLSEIIFNNSASKSRLETITHPKIRSLFLEKLKALSAADKKLIIYVVPLLFESKNKYPEIDKIIVVSSPIEDSIKRIMQRDNCSEEFARKKYSSQIPIAEKEKLADFIIKNDGNPEGLKNSVRDIYLKLK